VYVFLFLKKEIKKKNMRKGYCFFQSQVRMKISFVISAGDDAGSRIDRLQFALPCDDGSSCPCVVVHPYVGASHCKLGLLDVHLEVFELVRFFIVVLDFHHPHLM